MACLGSFSFITSCHVNFSDSIESNVVTAADHVDEGNTQLNKAATYQVNCVLSFLNYLLRGEKGAGCCFAVG